jgi:hypothetical protein
VLPTARRKRRRETTPALPRLDLDRDAGKVGWRYWGLSRIDGVHRLRSPFRNNVWPIGGPMVAECLGSMAVIAPRSRPHSAPAPNCRCGIHGGTYGALSTFINATYVPPAEAAVFGRVRLWGVVIEEQSAWRAAYAYPETLLVPTLLCAAYAVATDLEDYGVPVTVLDAAETFAALHLVTLRGVD